MYVNVVMMMMMVNDANQFGLNLLGLTVMLMNMMLVSMVKSYQLMFTHHIFLLVGELTVGRAIIGK